MAESEQERDCLHLQVAEAQERDVGKGIARLARTAAKRLSLNEGDVVEILGRRNTAAIVLPPYPEDVFRNFFALRTFGLHEIRLLVTSTTPGEWCG